MGYFQLADTLILPDNTAGCLDWFSGLLFVNESLSGWKTLFPEHSDSSHWTDRAALMAMTLTHETFHFTQIVTTGYGYFFATVIYDELSSLLLASLADTKPDGGAIKRLLLSPPAPTRNLQLAFHDLNMVHAHSLSARTIFETAAYLYEHKMHISNLNNREFLRRLNMDMPPTEYRAAYDLAYRRYGDTAFAIVLPSCFLALCFRHPAVVYPELLAAMANGTLKYDGDQSVHQLLQTARDIASTHEWLGTATDMAVQYPDHPVYYPAVMALNKVNPHVSALAVDPAARGRFDSATLVRPIFFRDGDVSVPPLMRAQIGNKVDVALNVHALMAALARRVFEYRETRTPRLLEPTN